MEIIDLRNKSDIVYKPIQKVNNKILCEQIKQTGYNFPGHKIFNYYIYDTNTKTIKKLIQKNSIIAYSIAFSKYEQDENSIYYLIKEDDKDNYYSIYKIDLENENETKFYDFKLETKLYDIVFYVLDYNNIMILGKSKSRLEININNKSDRIKYGFDRGYLFEKDTDKRYKIYDKYFLKSIRNIFFKTKMAETMCFFYEENYMDLPFKLHKFENIKNTCLNEKTKLYYKNSLKVIPVNNFIQQIKSQKSIKFFEICSKGYEGYERLIGHDANNIYFIIVDFKNLNEERFIMLNKNNLKRKVYKIKSVEKIDEYEVTYSFDFNLNAVFAQKTCAKNKRTIKEVINGRIYYSYPDNLGLTVGCVDEKYLITYNYLGLDAIYTNIIDMQNNIVKQYKGCSQIIDKNVVLF